MYTRFLQAFEADQTATLGDTTLIPDGTREPLVELLHRYGGCSFGDGAYRVLTHEASRYWTDIVCDAFPAFYGRIAVFGFDWLGRAFAIDEKRLEVGGPGVLMLQPGTGDALEIPRDVVDFHNEELVVYREEALAQSFFFEWRRKGGDVPSTAQCIGYKVPLFLGGADSVSNLELVDLDVYWSVMTQLLAKLRTAN